MRRNELHRYYQAHEKRHLRGYRRGQVTAAEYQEYACLTAIAGYAVDRSRGGTPPRLRRHTPLRATRAIVDWLAGLRWLPCAAQLPGAS